MLASQVKSLEFCHAGGNSGHGVLRTSPEMASEPETWLGCLYTDLSLCCGVGYWMLYTRNQGLYLLGTHRLQLM